MLSSASAVRVKLGMIKEIVTLELESSCAVLKRETGE